MGLLGKNRRLLIAALCLLTATAHGAITFVNVGAFDSGNAAVTPSLPAGIAADDILIMCVQSANETISTPTNSTSGTWAQIVAQAGTGTAASAGSTRLAFFWMRVPATAIGTVTVADSGNHTLAQIAAYRGCKATGNPWNATSASMSVDASGGSNMTITAIQTTVSGCWLVAGSADSFDSTSTNMGFNAVGMLNIGTINQRFIKNISTGTGGGIQLGDATITATGTNTQLNVTGVRPLVGVYVALEPAAAPTAPPINGQFFHFFRRP